MKDMPMKGFGTFIGIEHHRIDSPIERFETTKNSIKTALIHGYRHFDLASNYFNLDAVREAFSDAFKSSEEGGMGFRREDVWITMKGHARSSTDIECLLRKTGLEYFDLYLEHHPTYLFSNEANLLTQWTMLSTLALEKVRHIGVSNCYQSHLDILLELCEAQGLKKPYANEIEINLYNHENELVEFCQTQGIRVIAYSPLAYNWSQILPPFSEECERLGCSNKQLILAWLVSRGIAVIPSSRNTAHQRENFEIDKLIPAFNDNDVSQSFAAYNSDTPVTITADNFKKNADELCIRSIGLRR